MRSRNLLPVTITVAALGAAMAFAPMAGASSAPGASPMMHSSAQPGVMPAKPHHQCYSVRKGYTGSALGSATYPDEPIYNNAAAADFSVTKPCIVSEVDVAGQYFTGTPTATSETVTFYDNTGTDPNGNPAPGNVIGTPQTVTGTDNAGSFQIPLSPMVKLMPGTYWVSVVANMPDSSDYWYWDTSSLQKQAENDWSNSGGGDGFCPTWDTISDCFGSGYGYSMMVQLVKYYRH